MLTKGIMWVATSFSEYKSSNLVMDLTALSLTTVSSWAHKFYKYCNTRICWLLSKGLGYKKNIRDVSILLCNSKDNLIVFLLCHVIQKGEQCVLDCVWTHQSSYNGESMDGVDPISQIIGVKLLFKEIESVDILHSFLKRYLNQCYLFFIELNYHKLYQFCK